LRFLSILYCRLKLPLGVLQHLCHFFIREDGRLRDELFYQLFFAAHGRYLLFTLKNPPPYPKKQTAKIGVIISKGYVIIDILYLGNHKRLLI